MSILGPALLLAVGLVLLAAGAAHLRDPRSLRDAVRAHGVLPPAAVPPRLLGAGETVLGAVLIVAALGGGSALGRWSGAGAALLLAVMAGYLALARARQERSGGPALPCGCGVGEAPLGGAVVARSGALALTAVVGALTASSWSIGSRPLPEAVVALAAGLTLAIGLALLPAARRPAPADEAVPA